MFAGASAVELLAVAAVGLLGGAHCLGMCGPLVSLYADRIDARDAPAGDRGVTWHAIRQHLTFNLGRTAGYAGVGAILGGVGALAFDAAAAVTAVDRFRGGVGVAVGLFVVATGTGYALRGSAGGHVRVPLAGDAFGRLYGAITARVDGWVGGPRIAALGAVHAALPCPITYPAYLYALSTGSVATGALVLGTLGLGTIPSLFAYGTALGAVPTATRRRLHRALGAAFVVLGLVPLVRGLNALGVPAPHLPIGLPHPTTLALALVP